ncbi:MAG: FadR/GntR family transcriptional regulator [Ruthenibacterium sp.]
MANNLTDQVYDKLLQMIIEGNYNPQDRLPSENELSEMFGVSRNTVRTALNKLNVLGFTETRHGGGTYIKKIGGEIYLNYFLPALLMDSNDLLEVMEFRKGIEVQAVKLAAQRATQEDIATLTTIFESSQQYLQDMEQFAFYNTNFHAEIAKASHNKMFHKMMDVIRSIIMTKMQNFLINQGEDIDSNFYHSMILQCITNRKPEEAAFFMDKHMTLVIQRVKEFSETQEK